MKQIPDPIDSHLPRQPVRARAPAETTTRHGAPDRPQHGIETASLPRSPATVRERPL